MKQTLGGLVIKAEGIESQMKIANGRTGKLEGRVDDLETYNAEKTGGSKVWFLIATACGSVLLVVLGAFLAYQWK